MRYHANKKVSADADANTNANADVNRIRTKNNMSPSPAMGDIKGLLKLVKWLFGYVFF